MMGTTSAGDMSAHDGAAEPISQATRLTPADEHQFMYVQLRPGTQMFRKCVTHLEHTLSAHPAVPVTIAGFAHEDHQYRLTLAVDLGPASQIAKFSPEVIAGYNFTQALFDDMFDFLPLYVGEPEAAERDLAAKLPVLITAATSEQTMLAEAV